MVFDARKTAATLQRLRNQTRTFSFPAASAPTISRSNVRRMTPQEIEDQASDIAPGTTIQIPSGYYLKTAGYSWPLQGTSARPIIVEPVPGGRVTIDCPTELRSGSNEAVIRMSGAQHVELRQGSGGLFRLTNSDGSRVLVGASKNRPQCIDLVGSPGITVRGLILDNGGNGITINKQSEDCRILDCITNCTGWDSPTEGRGRGHGLYVQAPGTLVRGHMHESGFGRAIQCYSTNSDVRSMTIEDCVMGPTATPSVETTLDPVFSFNSASGYQGDLNLHRCVIYNQRDRKISASAFFGQNGLIERHGPIFVTGNLLLAHPSFDGWHVPIDWRDNYTMGRIRSGGPAEVAWHLWEPDWADNALTWDAEFKSEIAGSGNTWVHGRPAEDLAVSLTREYWGDGVGWFALANGAGDSTVAITPQGFEIGEWFEVVQANAPLRRLAAYKHDGGPVVLPVTDVIQDPIGAEINATRRAEKLLLQTYSFRRLH